MSAASFGLPSINSIGVAVSEPGSSGAIFDIGVCNDAAIPTVNFGNDTTLCQDETLTLDAATPNATYLWHDNSINPTSIINQQGTYWVEVTVNNCEIHSDTIVVDLEDCRCTLSVPNSDGVNDQFSPIFDCDITEYSFIIFNRWGEIVFQSTDPYELWRGESEKGLSYASNGVYTYLIKYSSKDIENRVTP